MGSTAQVNPKQDQSHGKRTRQTASQDHDATGGAALGQAACFAVTRFYFRRQSPQQGYIVDFVCLKHKLVVEVDGAQHGLEAHLARDARRDSTLNRDGFAVLRFWNNEINDDIDGIVDTIFHRLTTMSVPLSG